MDKYKKAMLADKLMIAFGAIGVVCIIVIALLCLQGNISFSIGDFIILPIAVFFIYYGIKMMKKDKEKYGRK